MRSFRPPTALLLPPLLVATLAALGTLAFAAESDNAGDIPDTQAFVRYASAAGYSVLAPEGWSRTAQGKNVTFTSHFNGERVVVVPRSQHAGTLQSIAVHPGAMKSTTLVLGSTHATRLAFSSESQPDAVTGKTIRLDDEAYVFTNGSREAIVHLWAPHGSDNADQWSKIAQSFRWR